MQTIVKETDKYYLCCFQLKDDFWSYITAQAREKEAMERRKTFHVVNAKSTDEEIGNESGSKTK